MNAQAIYDVEGADGQWLAECESWRQVWAALNTLLIEDREPGPLMVFARGTERTGPWSAQLDSTGHVYLRS